jgi:predicted DNA-binding protein
MQSSSPPINLPDDVRRGLDVAAGEAGKTPSEIVMEALERFGIERLSEDQFQKRMTGSQ